MKKIKLTKGEDRVRISDKQAASAWRMREHGKTWAQIASRLGVPELAVIRRIDRVLSRKMGMRAPAWLYDTNHPDYERD